MVIDDFHNWLDEAWRIHPEDKDLSPREIISELQEEVFELAAALEEKDKLHAYNEALDVAVVAFRIALGEFKAQKKKTVTFDIIKGAVAAILDSFDSYSVEPPDIVDLNIRVMSLATHMFVNPVTDRYYFDASHVTAIALYIANELQEELDDSRSKS